MRNGSGCILGIDIENILRNCASSSYINTATDVADAVKIATVGNDANASAAAAASFAAAVIAAWLIFHLARVKCSWRTNSRASRFAASCFVTSGMLVRAIAYQRHVVPRESSPLILT